MAFKLAKNPEFTHKVTIPVPIDGGHRDEVLKCRFRVVSAETLALHDLMTAEGTESYLRAICVRFEDVVDEAGQPIEHSDELTEQLIALPFVRLALVRAYTAAMAKARLGN
jgi:hypothetical protein